jgi:FemAB-related protein (PEP-CTERM system-associated)
MTGRGGLHVKAVLETDLPSWQAFVDRTAGAGCMHHAGWYKVLRDAYWVTPHFLMATDQRNEIRGILPLYFSRSPFTGKHLSSLEDGVLCDDPRAAQSLIEAAIMLKEKLGARYLQIRGGPGEDAVPAAIVPTVQTVIPTARPVDAIWSAVKKKTRWTVRQAEKQDVRIKADPGLSRLEEFYHAYAAHMRELGTPVFGIETFTAIHSHLGRERLRLFVAIHEERLIGGMLCIVNRDQWTDYYAIVRPSERADLANYLLYWHAIRAASEAGTSRLNLARSAPDSNVHMFKRKWGGTDIAVPYRFYPATGARRGRGLEAMKQRRGVAQTVWSRLPLPLCNRLGPLLRKQLPFI